MKEIKTGDMYQKLQKELDKGNAVLVEVDIYEISHTRWRLVTPENCEFTNDYLDETDSTFFKSCFVRRKKSIVKNMQVYDKVAGNFIVKMLVL